MVGYFQMVEMKVIEEDAAKYTPASISAAIQQHWEQKRRERPSNSLVKRQLARLSQPPKRHSTVKRPKRPMMPLPPNEKNQIRNDLAVAAPPLPKKKIKKTTPPLKRTTPPTTTTPLPSNLKTTNPLARPVEVTTTRSEIASLCTGRNSIGSLKRIRTSSTRI